MPLNSDAPYFTELESCKLLLLELKPVLSEYHGRPPDERKKEDNTMVSTVDTAIGQNLAWQLPLRYPGYGCLQEESPENAKIQNFKKWWIIDPLDGSRLYGKGGRDYSVMVALMERDSEGKSHPVMSCIYVHAMDVFITAIRGHGAYIDPIGKEPKKLGVDKSIGKRNLVYSNNKTKNDLLDEIIVKIAPGIKYQMGSSLKITEVAKGNATIYVHPPNWPMHIWDTAPTSLVLEEAGGTLTDCSGEKINYDSLETHIKHGVLATNGLLHKEVLSRLQFMFEDNDPRIK